MSTEDISIYIVDSQPLYREGIKLILSNQNDFIIKGEGRSILEVEESLYIDRSPVILFATNTPNDLQQLELIKKFNESLRVLSLCNSNDSDIVTAAIKAGADGFIVKDKACSDELITAIYTLHNKGCYLQPCITKYIVDEYRLLVIKPNEYRIRNTTLIPEPKLTNREEEVLRSLTKGLSNKSIAEQLFISEKTVKNHVSNIMRKLNVSDRTQAAILAIKSDWI